MLDTTDNSIADYQADINRAIAAINTIILGKSLQVKLAVCCLLARGHCLIEDLPGVGKTTLSQSVARVFGLEFNRIQFTSDLLPADILGVSIFDPEARAQSLPIFCSPTKSIARRPKRKAPCSKPWRKSRLPWKVRLTAWKNEDRAACHAMSG